MQVLGSRRGGIVVLVIAGVAFAAAAVFAVVQLLQRPTVDAPTPSPGSAVAEARPAISFSVDEGERLGDLQVTLDGRDVTSRVRGAGGELTVTPVAKLADGAHDVDVSFASGNVFARTVSRSWSFDVDTVAPRLAVAAPKQRALRARKAVKFQGMTEAGSTVTVAYKGGEKTAQAGADGAWSAVARLPEGDVATTVTAADRAGNTTAKARSVTVDTTAPRLAVSAPAKGEQLTETDEPLVYGTITADDPKLLTFTASVNGEEVATRARPRRGRRRRRRRRLRRGRRDRPGDARARRAPLRDGHRHAAPGAQQDSRDPEGPRRQRGPLDAGRQR